MAENRDDRLLMSAVRRLGSMRYHLARRILFLWIKPNILDCQPEALSLAQEDAVCYVLPYRSLTDLMVIDEACQRAGIQRPYLPILHPVTGNVLEERAVFFLARPEGLMGRKSLRRFSERMQRLLNHQNDPQLTERPIKIVPVSIFWGQQPDKERSLFKTMLSENWNVTSRFKKFMAGLFHPRHILVQFNKPIVLSELIASTEDEKIRSRKLSRLLRVHFRRQKQAILGPDLSHRRTLIHTLISSSGVMQAVREESDKNDISLPQAEQRANAYAREIVSHQTFGVIRFFYILLSWLWNRLYDGINLKGIDQVKELARDHEIVYIPCHRSHIDYLLLSYVLYVNGLT
ncbi:MAG: 1-acyl-sn-glycerol-3-phosphate acyltransferase, partial [Gammaproteobacteria bacterium]|nr:1-acyl-sn-glycerol-3-phosphate acyltransferase [Gammaproteobacteria bacterium]